MQPAWAVSDPFGDPDDDGDGDGDGDAPAGGDDDGLRPGAEHALLLFDCAAAMFRTEAAPPSSSPGPAPMDVAVDAAHRFLRTKIRDVAETKAGKRDAVGVLLYGCDPRRRGGGAGGAPPVGGESDGGEGDGSSEEEEEEEERPTTHELVELAAPGVEQVLTLQACRPGEERGRERRDLRREFAAGDGEEGREDEDAAMHLLQALTLAQKIFANSK